MLLPNALDTYANLLYKLGQTNKAIQAEELAVTLSSKYFIPEKKEEFLKNIEKMKTGKPTWD